MAYASLDIDKGNIIGIRTILKIFQHNSNHISSVYEDSRATLWIGTFDNGINIFDKKKENSIVIRIFPTMKQLPTIKFVHLRR